MAFCNEVLREAASPILCTALPVSEARRDTTPLVRTWDLETFYDLTVLLTDALAGDVVPRSMFPDSRDIMDTVLIWTNDFNRIYAYENWDREDYLESVERWFNHQIRVEIGGNRILGVEQNKGEPSNG